jgi:hypothetical protein
MQLGKYYITYISTMTLCIRKEKVSSEDSKPSSKSSILVTNPFFVKFFGTVFQLYSDIPHLKSYS